MSIADAFDVLVVAGWFLFFFGLFLPRAGEGLQRVLLDLEEVRPHLAPGRAVNAQERDGAIPVPEKRILRVETVQ